MMLQRGICIVLLQQCKVNKLKRTYYCFKQVCSQTRYLTEDKPEGEPSMVLYILPPLQCLPEKIKNKMFLKLNYLDI